MPRSGNGIVSLGPILERWSLTARNRCQEKSGRVARLPVAYVQITKLLGHWETTPDRIGADVQRLRPLFDRFDATARKEGITHVSERRSYESWATEVKSLLATLGR
ncbi:MAG: hypothetical protein L0Z62_02510 [Gemmataceae bacterium]|nr:hypothetical protein [Gemmataceae bacterium]